MKEKNHGEDRYQLNAETETTDGTLLRQRKGKPEKMKNTEQEKEFLDAIKEEIKKATKTLEQMTDYHNEDVKMSLGAIRYICHTYQSYRTVIADFLCDVSCPETCIKILKETLTEWQVQDDNTWAVRNNTLRICWKCSNSSLKFAKRLAECGAVQFMSNILSQQHYCDNLDREREATVVKASLGVLRNIALKCGNITDFKNSKTVEALMPFTKSSNEKIKIHAFLTLAHIVVEEEEEEEEKLTDKYDTIKLILQWIRKALDDKTERGFDGFEAWELAAGLARLAVNNANKRKIVEEKGLDIFLTILEHAEPVTKEQHWVAQCVCQLAGDQDILKTIRDYVGLVQALKDLEDSEDVDVRESVGNALQMIRGYTYRE